MFKSLLFQLATIWIYLMFCCGLLWCKILNMFFNMEWAIKLLYLGMNLICENIVKIEDNWMNKFVCSKTCGKSQNEDNTDDDTESFEDFIKKIKNENSMNNTFNHFTNLSTQNLGTTQFGNTQMGGTTQYGNSQLNNTQQFVGNPQFGATQNSPSTQHIPQSNVGIQGQSLQNAHPIYSNYNPNHLNLQNNNSNNFNSAQISTLNFPNPNPNSNIQNLNNNNQSIYASSETDDVDHDKIKRLIDRMYMKSVIEENDDNDNSPKMSAFSRKSHNNENKQIIFSRGIKEIESNIPEPN